MVEYNEVQQAKSLYKELILSKPNVVGVGMGYKVSKGVKTDELSLVVLVREKLGSLDEYARIPRMLEGVKTDVVQVGEVRAQQSPTGRFRPAPGGVSIGHYLITAGTLGVVARDKATGERLILSNNHVLANSNEAQIGDPILQPGAADGGRTREDAIATLERFVPVEFNKQPGDCQWAGMYAEVGNTLARTLRSRHKLEVFQVNPEAVNRVDAAVARPIDDADVLDEILDIGGVSGTVPAELGMSLRKSGRTTGFTTGTVEVLDATLEVSYGLGKTARFERQILAGPMSKGGDSGSLVVHGDSQRAVGLLFAGSDQTTVLNPIQDVLDALNLVL